MNKNKAIELSNRYKIIMLLLLSSCVATKQVETKNHTYSLRGKEVKSFKKSEKAYNTNAQGSRVFILALS